ncbi:MAG: hypothetical protein K8S18_04240 [Desulfobacula sp.]|nr:hypothetical protein [Desulfobacula sp.]
MTTTFYKIRTITNLHVGAGDANYGVIDNLVQRDVVTGLPVIHGSSLKGAIREFYEYSWGGKDERLLGILEITTGLPISGSWKPISWPFRSGVTKNPISLLFLPWCLNH